MIIPTVYYLCGYVDYAACMCCSSICKLFMASTTCMYDKYILLIYIYLLELEKECEATKTDSIVCVKLTKKLQKIQ